MLEREGTIKGEHDKTSGLSSGYPGTKHLGLLAIHRPSTLAVSWSPKQHDKDTVTSNQVLYIISCPGLCTHNK